MIELNKLRQFYKFSRNLSFSDANILIKAASTKTFEKKEIFLNAGSERKQVIFVRKGLIRQYLIDENGNEITFALYPENLVIVNVDTILFDKPSRFYYEAHERTDVFILDYDKLHQILIKHPKLMENRIHFAQKMMKEMHRRIEQQVLLTPEERNLQFIKDFPDINNRVPDKYIATVLGQTPVSLSRIRARLANQNSY